MPVLLNAMRKILVPTDFSENAYAAARYAMTVAQQYRWSVHLLHAYQAFSSSFGGEDFNTGVLDREKNLAIDNMMSFEGLLKSEFPDTVMTSQSGQGELSHVLSTAISQERYELMVIGTKGASGLKHVVLGSNAFNIIRMSPMPVITVPDGKHDFHIDGGGLLTNFKPTEISTLQTYIELFGVPSSLTLIHFFEKSSEKTEEDLQSWAETLMHAVNINDIGCLSEHLVGRLDVREDIPAYIFNAAESNGINCLLVTRERKGFVNRLFSRSLVKAVAHQLKIPVFFQNA